MAAPAVRRNEFADLDRLIVRALVTLRAARDECRRAATPRNLELSRRAEENLDALLDFRSEARRRASGDTRVSGRAAPDRLHASAARTPPALERPSC